MILWNKFIDDDGKGDERVDMEEGMYLIRIGIASLDEKLALREKVRTEETVAKQ